MAGPRTQAAMPFSAEDGQAVSSRTDVGPRGCQAITTYVGAFQFIKHAKPFINRKQLILLGDPGSSSTSC